MIKLQQITKIYHEKTPFGVSNIDLNVKEKEFLTLVGPSGSGKSTLLNIINQTINPDTGTINIKPEVKIAHLSGNDTINHNKTVMEFLLDQLSKDLSEEQRINAVRTTLSLFELTTELNKKPFELSSGQYQRVLLSKCLVQNPNVILLDEPFSHLDLNLAIELRLEFFSILKEKEITLIWVTHDLTSALTFSNRIAVLNLGKIEQLGSPEDIYQNPKNLFIANLFPNSAIVFENNKYHCYRPESIIVSQDGSKKGIVKNLSYQGRDYLAEFEFEDKSYYAYLPSNSKEFYFEFNPLKIYPVQEL